MLPNRTATAFCALLLCALAMPSAADAALVTYFNFNNYTATDQTTVSASNGNGSMTLGDFGMGELTVATGTTQNAVGADSAGNAVSMGNNGNANDTSSITMAFNTQGYSNLQLSFAAMASNSAYNVANVQYSLNGTDFFDAMPPILFDPGAAGSYTTITQSLSTVTQLNNKGTAYLRLVLSGSQLNAGQNLIIDNLQINGTSVPEAPAVAMMITALVLFGGVAYRRRRAAAAHTVPAPLLAA